MTTQKDYRVRVCIDHGGVRQWFTRTGADGRPCTVAFDNIGTSALLSREIAVVLCKKLRLSGFDAHVITRTGTLLFEEETAPPPKQTPAIDRTNMTCAGILIVHSQHEQVCDQIPPGTSYESICDVSPEKPSTKKLQSTSAQGSSSTLTKYQAPEEPLADPREIERQLNFEKHDRMRQRPGNER